MVVVGDADPAETEEVRVHALRSLEALEGLLGADRVPRQVTVRLEGPAKDGEWPTVDPATGEVRLYTFPGPSGGYTASLSHELVHRARFALWSDPARQTDPFLFLEEAMAELVASEIGAPSTGFPLFGTTLDVAAGQWLVRGEDLRIEDLVEHHAALNFRCLAQAYGLRLSFVRWLRTTRGLDPLIALAWQAEPMSTSDLERAMGAPLPQLAADWRSAAIAAYDAAPDHDAKAERYRTETPIRWFPVCTRDVLSSGQ